MTPNSADALGNKDTVNKALALLLHLFSAYALPVAIGLMSLVSLFTWEPSYTVSEPQALELRAIKTDATVKSPQEALSLLQSVPATKVIDTELSEAPVWLSFTVEPGAGDLRRTVEFPSRHASTLACWGGPELKPMGSASLKKGSGTVREIKSGYALDLNPEAIGNQIVCRVESVGPARISALQWRSEDLQVSAFEFHRKSGLLDGGLMLLAVFVAITALINRNSLYLIFAAWLVVNLRMGALTGGWDSQWLGNAVPADWMLRVRAVTMAIFYVLSVGLFGALFTEDLAKLRAQMLLRVIQWSCIPLLVLAIVLPYKTFLPLLWVSTGVTIGVVVLALTIILIKTRSQVAMWYTASIGITLAASLVEDRKSTRLNSSHQ